MKTFFLHIGPYKTGTTALQVFFAQNMHALQARGITYLPLGLIDQARQGKITAGNGAFVARSLLPSGHEMSLANKRKAIFSDLQHKLQSLDTKAALLSSEFFCDVNRTDMTRFKDFLSKAGFQLHILMCVREQASYLESYYIQRVKRHHQTQKPVQYFADAPYKTIEHLHYGSYAENLGKIVGQSNISVCRYPQENIFDTFCNMMGTSLDGLSIPDRQVNVSLSPENLAIMIELNKFKPRQSISDQIVASEVVAQGGKKSEKRTILSPEIRDQIRTYFQAENDKLSDLAFGGAPCFTDKDKEYADLDMIRDALDIQSIIDLFGGLVIAQEDRLSRLENTVRKLIKP
ncbi:hypothetical protein GCM10017044_19730 [Kordiimonas sediminis]|uniref:Sulfotransferase family protein n=1 Tax=Kordiimonas sediminis TaxID=1735581 RepID=A0A919AVD8_9PROT|nr:hypothetical protein [Kordiimonas sediminis]GHF25010.1 hypothetical protein GCM10017044_19730 [Kordiimonas sediminis]